MSQSYVIAGALAAAFVLFITMRGDLPKYLYAVGVGQQPGS